LKAIADRYASALLDVAWKQKDAEQVRTHLASFAATVAGSAELRAFLSNPAVPRESKRAVLKELMKRLDCTGTMQNFLDVVVDHRRAGLLPEISEAYNAKLNTKLGIAEAAVTSAAGLSAQEKSALVSGLERATRLKIAPQYAVDGALLGGASVRIGSVIYDGSVREQLRRLENEMAAE
jgi:F-type H+-transporting ATPase subunit delta